MMLAFCFGCLFAVSLFSDAELVTTCSHDEFPCNDGSCIDKDRWCDSATDCDDDTDELYCSFKSSIFGFNRNPNRCNEKLFFLCEDGQCIPAIGRCDGYSSCYDNSDEENCGTAENASSLSATGTQARIKVAEKSFVTSNRSDFKTFESLHSYEDLMQVDPTEMVIGSMSVPVIESSNTSESLSSPVLKQTDYNLLKDARSTDVPKHVTNREDSEINPRVSINHHQALDFRSLLGVLNASRIEQNTTSHINLDVSQKSVLFNSTSDKKPDVEVITTSDVLSDQSNESNHSEVLNILKGNESSQSIADKEEDLEKGYVSLNPRDFRKSKERALQWLINSRDKDYGWGDETARALIALHMSDYSDGKPNERMLMTKQLHLKLFTSISRNETQRIPLGELALYINAMSASCDNPRNFYGHDLVSILRQRTNNAQGSSEFVTPFVYLVLCVNNVSTYGDVRKVHEMLFKTKMFKIDGEALMSLAATCISRTQKFQSFGIEEVAAKELYRKVKAGRLPTNIYELALVTQALNEARINQNLWNRTEAMHRITESQENDGSFGDILSTYYALPTLSGKSFLWIGKNCPNKDTDFIPLEVLKNGKDEKMFIYYSLRFGNPVKMSQGLTIKVQKNTSFMDIMRIAGTINPVYEFKHDTKEGKTSVYSIGGIANDAERGLYWAPYTSRNSSGELVPLEGDIRSYIPAFGENLSFWMKPLF